MIDGLKEVNFLGGGPEQKHAQSVMKKRVAVEVGAYKKRKAMTKSYIKKAKKNRKAVVGLYK